MRSRRLVPLLLTAVVLSGCGGEDPPPVDDGAQAGVVDGAALAAADVEVLDAAAPAAATGAEVAAALAEAGSRGASVAVPDDLGDLGEAVAVDTTQMAGLLAVVGDRSGAVAVLVFDDPASAAVLAAEDRTVFTATRAEQDRRALLSGNLVGYAADATAAAHVRRALRITAGPPRSEG